jgi:hypothetical protein
MCRDKIVITNTRHFGETKSIKVGRDNQPKKYFGLP